jgi:hypothetical protein
MEVRVKALEIELQVKQKGIEMEVRSKGGKEWLGNFYATLTGLVWCKGKTKKETGVWVTWEDFMEICTSNESLKAAVHAAKGVKESSADRPTVTKSKVLPQAANLVATADRNLRASHS